MQFLKDSADEVRHFMSDLLNKEIVIKPLFIGNGVFYDNLMFGIYVNRAFHLKAEGKLAELLIKNGAIPWNYAPRKHIVTGSTYYRLPETIYQNPAILKKFILLSIEQIKAKKINTELAKKSTIRELPNLSVKHERALAKIGINNVAELKACGAINAFIQLKQSGKDINIAWFWAILAALANKHVNVLSLEERKTAFDQLNRVLAEKGMRSIKPEALLNQLADRP